MAVYLVGAGPGDPGLITVKGKILLQRADVVIYDYLANDALLSLAPAHAERIFAGKKNSNHSMTQDEINALLVKKGLTGKTVVRLKGGDPLVFGRGGEEAVELAKAGIAFEIVPGVTSAIAAAAYAGIPLTHRECVSSVIMATGHEADGKLDCGHNWKALAQSDSTLVFLMGMKNLGEISQKLINAGKAPETPAAVVRWATTGKHKTLISTLGELPQKAVEQGFAAPSVIIVGEAVKFHDQLAWFEKKPLLGKTVVVTRTREQAAQSAILLAEAGAEVITFPTIRIAPLEDWTATDQHIARLAHFQWVVFTSANGVAVFWERLRAVGKDARYVGQCKVAAVGPVTAKALVDRGIYPDYMPETYMAEAVAEGLAGLGVDGQNILLAQASHARPELANALGRAGAKVTALPLYMTLPAGEKKDEVLALLLAGCVDCVTFGSSSSVESFLGLIGTNILSQLPNLKFACIGPVTAATLEKAGLECHIVPAEATIPALVAALREVLQNDCGKQR